jgi:hypothetical protein
MPRISSTADVLIDWEKLLTSVAQNRPELPNAESHRLLMEQVLAQAKETKARRDAHVAGKQAETQALKEILRQGREQASRLRGVVKADLGIRNERLVQFGITPQRKRVRRSTEKPPEVQVPPPQVEAKSGAGEGGEV